ncbi:MAG: FHIPEP family type III secretion protein [Bacteroidota bacterium]
MQPVLNISTGDTTFTTRILTKSILENTVTEFLGRLGIIAGIETTTTDSADFLMVDGKICRYPAALVKEVENSLAHTDADGADAEFWQRLIEQVLWLQPWLLFPESSLADYFPGFDTTIPAVKTSLPDLVYELLELKLSIGNKEKIRKLAGQHKEIEFLREALVESLSGSHINICIHPAYFQALVALTADNNIFEMIREGMFYETGISYPPFKVALDDELPAPFFYFEVNAYRSIPFKGILTDTILVNDSPDRIALLGIKATPATNPANGNLCAFIPADKKPEAEKSGLMTWDALGYFIICFSSFLRTNGQAFITKKLVLNYAKNLNTIYPALVGLAMPESRIPIVTKVLRLLAKEKISIRNLKTIFEAVAGYGWVIGDDHRFIIFDERVPVPADTPDLRDDAELIAGFVRTKLKKEISNKYSRGQGTLVVYLLDPAIEKIFCLADSSPVAEPANEDDRVLQAAGKELNNPVVSQQQTVVLTTQSVRPHFKRCIETVYPHVAVLSYQELTGDMNIQPIARISF